MRNWIISKFAGPVLPILTQVYKVIVAIESNLKEIIKVVTDFGIPTNTPIFTTIQTVIAAADAIKNAVEKVIAFLGGTLAASAKLSTDLNKEIEELKKLL